MRSELMRRFGHEPLCKMDLMDPMDLTDMPQWQQTNRHGTHAVMAEGNTRLVCERSSMTPCPDLRATDKAAKNKAQNNSMLVSERPSIETLPRLACHG